MFRKKCQKILAGLCALLLMGTGKSTVLVSSASEQKKNFGLEKPAEVQIPFAISVSGKPQCAATKPLHYGSPHGLRGRAVQLWKDAVFK